MTRLRYLLRICHLALTLLPLLLSVEILRAQEWTPNLAQDGVPSAEHWRLDRNHFTIHEGKILLHAPRPKARGLSVLSTSSLLPERPSFTGRIAWDTRLTQANYSYILLCCVASSADTYDYVALALGGGHSGLALVQLSVQLMPEGSSPRIRCREGATLIEDERGEIIQPSSLDYRVDYSKEEGWTLYVASPKKPSVWRKVGVAKEPKVDLARSNSFAWVCGYSANNNEAWELSRIKITPVPKEDTPPSPDDEEPQAQGIDPHPGQHIILSEVMSAPKTDGCEYIELYNPTEEALSLLPYRLAVGKDVDSFKLFAFPDQSLSSKAFLVLTKDAQQLLRLYPQLSSEEVLEVALPRLLNKAGVIGLIDEDGKTIDSFSYDVSRLPKGLRSKRGIAWERKDILLDGEDKNWLPARAKAGYATPARPNSCWLGSLEDDEDGGDSKATTLHALLQELATHPDYQHSWRLYDVSGSLIVQSEKQTTSDQLTELSVRPFDFLARLVGARRGLFLLRVQIFPAEGDALFRSVKLFFPQQ